MKLIWYDKAWDDYLYWQTQDKRTLKRINELIPKWCLDWHRKTRGSER